MPTVASWIAGDSAGKTVEKVTSIAKDILGTDDAQAVEHAISTDPNLALQFKLALLKAEADEKAAERQAITTQPRLSSKRSRLSSPTSKVRALRRRTSPRTAR